MDDDKKPALLIPIEHYRKILAYVANCETEIMGFFDVEWNDERTAFLVTKVYDLLEQSAGGAHVEVDEEKMSAFTLELIKQGCEQLPRGWWHSHVDMGTFLSGTDEETVDFMKNDSFIVALVANKREEITVTIKMFKPFTFEIEKVPVRIIYSEDKINEAAKEEIDKMVSAPVYNNYQNGWNNAFGNKKNKKKKKDKKNGNGQLKYLPTNEEGAVQKVAALMLSRLWSNEFHDFIYIDAITEDTWIDQGQVMTYAAYDRATKLMEKMYA
jgi:proteasome lid subunit RPN8/RPN11